MIYTVLIMYIQVRQQDKLNEAALKDNVWNAMHELIPKVMNVNFLP